ncbi:alanine racemase, N-terminal domain protein, partial [Vibrio parahaemolyticus V-223/04]
LSATQTVSPVH